MADIKISNEDNRLLMAGYPDNYFDLAICDLEYGLGASKPSIKPNKRKQKGRDRLIDVRQPNYVIKDWDFKQSDDEYFKELFRVSKHQIIFGANYYPQLTGGMIVWDKLNGNSDQMDCEIAYCSMNKRTDLVYFLWNGMFQGKYCGKDVRKAMVQQGNKALNEKRIHPTQKPVPLYKWLLNNYAKPGYQILDTHLGSGSIAIACEDLGFDLTACEIETDYFEDAVNRLEVHRKTMALLNQQHSINFMFNGT